LVIGWSLAASATAQLAATPLPRTVLIIDEADASSGLPTTFSRTLRVTLSNVQPHITVFEETLGQNQFYDSRQETILQSYLREKYRDERIGLVVAVGSFSLELVNRWRSELWPGIPVVVTAIDETTAAELKLDGNTTGLSMRRSIRSMVEAARILVPDLQGIAVLGGVLERDAYRQHYLSDLAAASGELKVTNLTGLPLAEQLKPAAALPPDTAILYTAFFIDNLGTRYSSADALAEIAKVANRPIVIDVEALIGVGATGGFVLDNVAYGEQAASLVQRALDGEAAGSIPVAASEFTRPVFDWRQLQRWDVSESRLPKGSDIRYRELPLWQRYPRELAILSAAVLVQALMIGWLVYEHRRRHYAEIRSRDAMAELTYMNRVASAGQLSAALTHEINQPLTAITLRAGAALRSLRGEAPDLEQVRVALQKITDTTQRAADIVANVRAMFKKGGVAKKTPIDINKVIRSVLSITGPDLRRHDIDTQTSLGERLPVILGNEVELQQVVLNLIMNAIEAMSSTQPRVLGIRTELTKNQRLHVVIEDSGTGIAPSIAERIFAPMVTTKDRGMGMGLSICQSIIESHDGKIWVSPGTTRGSIFQFELPTALSEGLVTPDSFGA
jgi:signal transduction histidine kinase